MIKEKSSETGESSSSESKVSHIGLAADLILLYKDDGLPLYSRCFGEFCLKSSLQPELVTSFLEAITQFSGELTGEESQLKKIEFFGMEMNFRLLEKTMVRIVVILHDSRTGDSHIIDEICSRVDELIDEQFPQVMALGVIDKDMKAFHRELECEILNPWLHYVFPETDMNHNTHCPYCQDLLFSNRFVNDEGLNKRLMTQFAETHDILKKKPELVPLVEKEMALAKVRKRINPDC